MAIEAAEAFFARVSGHDPCRCAYCEHVRWRTVAALAPMPRCRAGPSWADLFQCSHYQRRPISAAQTLRAASGESAETPKKQRLPACNSPGVCHACMA